MVGHGEPSRTSPRADLDAGVVTEPELGEDDVIVLRRALALVQGDLDRTVRGAVQFQVVVIPEPERGDWMAAYVAGPDGSYWSNHGHGLGAYGLDDAIAAVADGVQEYLAAVQFEVWPVCPRHHLGVHVRPVGTCAGQPDPDPGFGGPAVWWCRADDGHDVALIGRLGL